MSKNRWGSSPNSSASWQLRIKNKSLPNRWPGTAFPGFAELPAMTA